MIFCDNSDLYISLYIDDQLEQNDKEEFLKHIEECPQCAQKLKEESYFIQLVNDEETVELPDDFSSSLHSKLIEVSKKEYNNKSKLLFFNKKLMAALSTAAVVVISLLAFKLLPDMLPGIDKTGYSESAAPQATAGTADIQQQLGSDTDRNAHNEEVNGSGAADYKAVPKPKVAAADSAQTQETAQDESAQKEAAARSGVSNSNLKGVVESESMRDFKVKASVKADSREKSENSSVAESTGNTAAGGGENQSEKVIAFSLAEPADDTKTLYYKNYVELNLTVSLDETEVEKLKKLMGEQEAVEQASGLMEGFAANYKDIVAYTDYIIPLSEYGSLKSEALLKYKLELQAKTDIIKTDVTEEYNNLEIQKNDIENKISEALNKGQDTTALEAEKSTLVKQTDKIIAQSGKITVRIFFVKK